MYLVEQRSR